MVRMKFDKKEFNAKELDVPYEGPDFERYTGEVPKTNTILRCRVTKMWALADTDDDGNPVQKSRIIAIAEGNTGKLKEYNGLAIWEYLTWKPSNSRRYMPFLMNFDLTVNDYYSKLDVQEDDDSVGTPIIAIGDWEPGSDDALCRIVVLRDFYATTSGAPRSGGTAGSRTRMTPLPTRTLTTRTTTRKRTTRRQQEVVRPHAVPSGRRSSPSPPAVVAAPPSRRKMTRTRMSPTMTRSMTTTKRTRKWRTRHRRRPAVAPPLRRQTARGALAGRARPAPPLGPPDARRAALARPVRLPSRVEAARRLRLAMKTSRRFEPKTATLVMLEQLREDLRREISEGLWRSKYNY